MSDSSTRLLRLLALLQQRRYWPGVDLAERLEVSERTLRRDVERLRELGYPVGARRGVDGGYQLNAGATLPPLMLDQNEAIALGVGLLVAVQGTAISGLGEASVRALAKVLNIMPKPLRRQVDAIAAMTVPGQWGPTRASPVAAEVLATVAQACWDEERIEFSYRARDGEETERLVEPHRLVVLGERWYLVAWDLTRFDWRSFRIDRLSEPKGTGARCIPRELPTDDAAEFVRGNIESVPAPFVVEAIVHAPGSDVRAHIGSWCVVEDLDERRCLVRITTDSLDWAVLALNLTDAQFEIVGPTELVAHLHKWEKRIRAATRGRASGATPT